jgi:tRNA (cytidine/uridine-2'-O-)-methyltransferase
MLHVVLFQPEIPPNTGNVGRLCAFTASRLHLIRPLGFSLDDRYLRRSGMDYWQSLDWRVHDNWESFRSSPPDESPKRLWLFTTHATRNLWDARFAPGDGLVFGSEGQGAPDWLHETIGQENRLRIPAFNPNPLRSLNLATSAGIALYEALRQIHA